MRLTDQERADTAAAAAAVWGPGVAVSPFGSRADDQARGGHIDLLVDLPVPPTAAQWVVQRQAFVAGQQWQRGDRRIHAQLLAAIQAGAGLVAAYRAWVHRLTA